MKKLLIMLIVIAMASFLFVGCLGTTPPIDPDEPDEPEPVLLLTVTPVIRGIADVVGAPVISLYSSATQYMNGAEVADGILVYGFAPKYSEVNIYVGGVIVGTGTAYGGDEEFTVFVDGDNLGADGAKTLYATAKELGFAESDPSTEYAFILDTVAPEMVEVAARFEDIEEYPGTVTATFSEELDKNTAEDEDDWTVANINLFEFDGGDLEVSSPELISANVVGLEIVSFNTPLYHVYGEPHIPIGHMIRVAYEGEGPIKDLAGNPAVESIEYCWLELEEE